MNEFIEKLIGRLEECEKEYTSEYGMIDIHIREVFVKIRKIVNQLAEEHKEKLIVDGQYCWQTCGATEHCKECNRLCNGSIDYYENYDSLAEECNDGWIPCSERLPEKYLHCLVTRRNDYEDGTYDSDVREDVYMELEGVWWWQSKFEGLFDDIIAWKPLPEPYQPKGE